MFLELFLLQKEEMKSDELLALFDIEIFLKKFLQVLQKGEKGQLR